MILAHLPPEILGFILSADTSSPMALRLWKCGCKLLNSKLSSHVTHVELHSRPQLHPKGPLPHILFNFRRLRYLCIESSQPLSRNVSEWPMVISSLPATLETLQIVAPYAHLALLNHTPESTYSSVKTIKTDYKRGVSCLVDLDSLFPLLQSLKIEEPDDTRHFLIEDFAGLPSQLQRFDARIVITSSSWYRFSLFPPSIRFIGRMELVNIESFDALPAWPAELLPELEEMSFWDLKEMRTSHWLPRSLTRCAQGVPWTSAVARCWPPSTQHLKIETVILESFADQQWYQTLPPCLTELGLVENVGLIDSPLELAELSCFPSSLTSLVSGLVLQWSDMPGIDPANVLPNLKTLDIAQSFVASTVESLQHLPQKLEIFRSWALPLELEFDISFLPSTITKLDLRMFADSAIITGTFPACLQHLTLVAGSLTRESFNLLCASLPPSITNLELSFNRPKSESASSIDWKIPSSLKMFRVDLWHCDGFSSLPRSLTDFGVDELRGIEDSPLVKEGSLFEQLPSNITSLNVNKDTAPKLIPVQRISHLRALKNLVVSSLGIFESQMVRNLPTDLCRLHIMLRSLEEEDAPFLPRKLEVISLGPKIDYNAPWVGQNWPLFAEFPPTVLEKAIQKRIVDFNN